MVRWLGVILLLFWAASCVGGDPDLSGWFCKLDADCGHAPGVFRCFGDRCRKTCFAQKPCPAGTRCINELCLPENGDAGPLADGVTADQTPQESSPEPAGPCEEGERRDCYTEDPKTRGIGLCRTGTQSCQKGTWGSCKGQISPKKEECNGLDDDCDGLTDEDFGVGSACTAGLGECAIQGTIICSDGKGLCETQKRPTPQVEQCNGKDDDCNGKVDDASGKSLRRDCYTGPPGTQGVGLCKLGQQRCEQGKWGPCEGEVKPQPKDLCDGKDHNCNGKSDEGCACQAGKERDCSTDTGACKKGRQLCEGGVWGTCLGGVFATAEKCNGVDDDCDGKTDEDFSNLGKSCISGTGACGQSGKYICSPDRKGVQCDARISKPTQEVCNGKDDNCNGQIDEGTDNKAPCSTGKRGACGVGEQRCINGKLNCNQTTQPKQELCRNGVDDDCDGQIDEICGPLYPYAVVGTSGTLVSGRQFTSSRQGPGNYLLNSTGGVSCKQRPIFFAAKSLYMRLMSYTCSNDAYSIYISRRIQAQNSGAPPAADGAFSAVLPLSTDAWAVSARTCRANGDCLYTKSGPINSIKRISKGYYEVESSLCGLNFRPIFVSVLGAHAHYSAVGYISSRDCFVEVYDHKGDRSDGAAFAIWLPDANKALFATITPQNNTLVINRSNHFGDQLFRWSAQLQSFPKNQCPHKYSGPCPRYRIGALPWANPGALLVGVRLRGPATTSFDYSAAGDPIVSVLGYSSSGYGLPITGTRFSILVVP